MDFVVLHLHFRTTTPSPERSPIPPVLFDYPAHSNPTEGIMSGLQIPTRSVPEIFEGVSGPVQMPVSILEELLSNASLQWFDLVPTAGGAVKPIL